MAALQVWSRAELDDRERVFQALVAKSLRLSARALEDRVVGILVANTAPEPEARSAAFTLALGEVGTVQATWTARVDAELMPYLAQTFADAAADAGKMALDVAGRSGPTPTAGFIDRVLSFLRDRLVALGGWLATKLGKIIQAGYDRGDELRQLATGVRAAAADALPVAAGAAADALGWASTLGELTQLQAAGFTNAEVEKQWLTADDDRVRPAHEEADGQRVGLFEMFDVGNERLFAPRDPTGRPDNVIRCRCSLGYVFNTDDADDAGDIEAPLTAHGGDSHNQKDHGRRDGMSVDAIDANPFRILPKSERGKSGDGMYAPGMWGRYGAAGIMMRHVDDSGKARYLVVQRANPGKNQWRWQLPGGAIDENETPAQGAAREAFEEVGATPELLAQLTPRGEHTVERPVEGKAPWRYTNVVADAPYQFTPEVDRSEGELWKALWLTEEQLLEMRGRNRLVMPFAENLEKIIAKFDEPTVAAADPDWDESKHPRAPKGTGKGGQFISKTGYGAAAAEKVKKATAAQVKAQIEAAKIPAGKPIHVNTAVIYKTQYDDGVVVAVNPGAAARLRWSAPEKKFLYQERQAAGHWLTTAKYGKGDAYKKFSGETGWHAPAPVVGQGLAPAPVTSKVTVPPLTSLPPSGVLDWVSNLSQDQWDELDNFDKSYIKTSVANLKFIDGGAALAVVDKLEVGASDESEPDLPSTSAPESSGKSIKINTATVYKMKYAHGAVVAEKPGGSPEGYDERLTWDDNLKKFVLERFIPSAGKWSTVKSYGKGEAYKNFSDDNGWFTPGKLATAPAVPMAAPPVTPAATTSHNKSIFDFSKMSPDQTNKWFASLTKEMYDGLSDADKQYLDDYAYGEELFGNTIPKTSLAKFSDKTAPAVDADATYGPHQLTDLHWGDNGPIVDGEISVALKYPKTPGSKDLYIAGYATFGDGNEVKLHDDNQVYVKSLHSDDISVLKELITDKVNAGGGKIVADADDGDVSVPTPATPTPMTSPPKYTPGIIPNQKDQLSGYIHQELIPTNDIGVPDPAYSGNYAVVDQTTMSVMQQGMLNKAGKKWTPQEIQAVQRYTTSVGYQTTNAVLRNDQTRLNMFSISQLQDGVKNAQALQSAMTPTIVSGIKVFRGTGAQAFGSPGKDISFDDLKKFEGKTITDDGFVSTTILDEKSTGFDYTKKPIRMEIEVPPGTPALYVSSATPGYSSENELILAAGTTLEIIEVRKATPAEKAAHSNSLKHIVRARVVPSSTGKTGPPAPTGTPVPTTVNPTSSVAPKLATSVPGKVAPAIPATTQSIGASVTPMDLNTTAIYKSKYAHGAVVAVRLLPDGAQRLVWSEIMKKFVFQQWDDAKNQWTTDGLPKITYTKKDAYAAFAKLSDWRMPLPGTTGLGSPLFPSSSTPSLAPSAPPASPTAAAPAVPSPATPNKITADELQKLHGALPATLSDVNKAMILKNFKTSSGFGFVTLGSPPDTVFDALIAAQKYAKEKLSSPVDLNLLQMLKLIDETSTPAGKSNANLYEKKIVNWLQTATGAAAATKSIANASLNTLDVVELRKQVVKPTDIGTPDVSVKTFSSITPAEASQMQAKMSPNSALTDEQRHALHLYTGNWFRDINGVLRQSAGYKTVNTMTAKKWLRHAVRIQETMRPITRDVITYRGTGAEQFGLPATATIHDIRKFIGKTITDDGFVSTSVNESSAFGNKIKLIIEAPRGTAARYVASVSQLSGERELLYAAGTKFEVLDVWDHDPPGVQINVRLRVVP